MNKKQFIYSLPHGFIEDPDVPVRWKIYATLTGFWIKGLTFYATNEWLEKELSASRRAIQYGLKELEDMKLIERNITGMSRLILPGGCNPLHGGVQSNDQKGCNPLHHNSDSNSDNINTASPLLIEDENEKPTRVAEDSRARYNNLIQWLRSLTGAPLRDVGKQYKWLKLAKEYGYTPTDLKEHAEKMWDNSFFRTNGMDWATVVQNLDKKTHGN